MSNKLILDQILFSRGEAFSLAIPHLEIPAKSTLGVVGPNGGGKTTLLQIISGVISPHRGKIIIDGRDVSRNLYRTRAQIGYIPDDEAWLVNELSADEYFSLLISIYQKAGIEVDLEQNVQRITKQLFFSQFSLPLGSLSHGNKKKVQITAALMHQPALLIVDELRNGLDPLAIFTAEGLLREYVAEHNGCVIAATHDVWWAEKFAQSILMLNNGKVTLQGKTKAIVQTHGSLEQAFLRKIKK